MMILEGLHTWLTILFLLSKSGSEESLLCGLVRVEYWWDPGLSVNMKLWRKERKDEMPTEAVDIWRWSRSE